MSTLKTDNMELYRKIFIKNKADYPKEEGYYFCCRNGFHTFQHLIPDTGEKTFMTEISWYLLPEELPTDEMIQKTAKDIYRNSSNPEDKINAFCDGVDWLRDGKIK